jgi:serine/threonine protein kinase
VTDELLADVFDVVLCEWREGRRADLGLLRHRYPAIDGEERLIEFFAALCQASDDWRTPDPGEPATKVKPDAPDEPQGAAAVGRYRILTRVGVGGMGTVYKARDPELGRVVAVKVPNLDPTDPDFEAVAARFEQEARLAATVEHPNVCPVYDTGRHDGMPYVVMAFIEGRTLSHRLRVGGRFDDAREAVEVVRQVAEGLAAVHRHRIVHRDVKPGNVLLRAGDGKVVLTDFGLARIARDGTGVSRPGVVAGTLAYMAPEQAAGDTSRIGPATDVYGLGMVLYQMLTGRVPFDGELPEVLDRIRSQNPPRPTSHRPDLDPRLEAIVRKATARDPAGRYPDGGAFADALRVWETRPSPGAAPGLDAPTVTLDYPAPRGRPRWWNIWAVVAAAGLSGALGIGVFTALIKTPPPLDGDLVVRVWTDPDKVPADDPTFRRKPVTPVDDRNRDALPVLNTDGVSLEVRLTEPAYVYLLWFPGEGGPPTPLYPWNTDKDKGFREPVGEQARVRGVLSPEKNGWKVVGPSGLDTAVLFARRTPLTDAQLGELEVELGVLPPTPLGLELKECAWLDRAPEHPAGWASRGTLRGIDTSNARVAVDEPVFVMLRRIQSRFKFDLTKAVRFAHVGDDRK